MHRRSEDILGEPDLGLPNHTLIMKLDSELVERSGTQRHRWASIIVYLKPIFCRSTILNALQIRHRRLNIAHAEPKAPSVTQNTPLFPLPQPETYQATGIWSSSSTSILPKPRLRRAQQKLHGASRSRTS